MSSLPQGEKMKIKFDFCKDGENADVTFVREEGDPKFYGIAHAKGEHALFHFLKKWLNQRGFNFIKKLAQKDGHMVGDQYQPYLRMRNQKQVPHPFALISGFYALHGANEDWNKGEVELILHGSNTNTFEFVRGLCMGREDMTCIKQT
jgi:hypothetical protein